MCILSAPLSLYATACAGENSSIRVRGVRGLLIGSEGVSSLFSGLLEGVFGELKRLE